MLPLRHLRRRKNGHPKLAPHPHPKLKYKFLDGLVYVAAIVSPVMTLPQVYIIWVEKKVEGLSLISWITYLVVAVIWLFYGLAHKDKPITISNTIWIVLSTFIVAGILVYQ